jgi:hypothetical protein
MLGRIQTASILAVCAIALVVASPAGAATYQVSGKQTVVDAEKGVYKMRGGLLGRWTTTSFEEVATAPYYQGRGTERFKGCLNRRHDRSCKGDPDGTLSFTFDYWALFGDGDALVWGSCWHPIVSGTGAFAGAQGVLVMVDTPTKGGVKTSYIGNVTLRGKGKSARASTARASSAVRAGCVAAR